IIHMNVRYLTVGSKWWFGGGIDLTPHYVKSMDAFYFHNELKKVCDKHGKNVYADFKKQADEYFFLKHRNETRGVGGIFFDHQTGNSETEFEEKLKFVKDVGNTFLPVYSK